MQKWNQPLAVGRGGAAEAQNTCRTTTGARCVAERCATRAAGSTYDDAVATSERSRSKRDMAAVRFRKLPQATWVSERLAEVADRLAAEWPPIGAPPQTKTIRVENLGPEPAQVIAS